MYAPLAQFWACLAFMLSKLAPDDDRVWCRFRDKPRAQYSHVLPGGLSPSNSQLSGVCLSLENVNPKREKNNLSPNP